MNLSYQKGIRIGIWNIRTLAQTSRLAQLSREMTRCKIKILGLSEVRWKNSGDITTSDNHYMIYSGNSTTHINGVGIVISTKIKKLLMEWNPVSDRLITARFRAKNRNITIIQCYAPTEIADDSEKDHFYNQLQSTIASAHKRDIKLVMGDFNGKIGNNNNNLDEIMGRHGLGEARNNNGERLIDLCMANRLFIGSTRFPHKDIHKYTWQAPDGVTRNQIDHVLIDKKHLKSLLDVRTMRSADMYSDHKLVVAKIRIRTMNIITTRTKQKKFITEKFKNKGERRNFCETVTAKVVQSICTFEYANDGRVDFLFRGGWGDQKKLNSKFSTS
ncbi:Craniofacial development protein 2 [Cyphomyrmex costatus]|uniref:Craniofacial development protein 2 n=1 Tax=Cyphomyrmex costatus TaxID=456900 RepID=A0A151IER9_9HYME|nr:Craniofacial development protein 2 [Cyphomyrmex costatus]